MDDTIRGYFKKGEKQGFSREYVRDILIQKGYDPLRVRMIYNTLSSKPNTVRYQPPDARFYNLQSLSPGDDAHHAPGEPKSVLSILLVIMIGALFIAGTSVFFFYAGKGMLTGAVVLDETQTKDAQAVLEGMSARDDEIAKKSRLIREQLDDINKLELTNEEKAQIIRRQLYEIQELHKQMETQREEIHTLLWDLMKDILKKGQREQEE